MTTNTDINNDHRESRPDWALRAFIALACGMLIATAVAGLLYPYRGDGTSSVTSRSRTQPGTATINCTITKRNAVVCTTSRGTFAESGVKRASATKLGPGYYRLTLVTGKSKASRMPISIEERP